MPEVNPLPASHVRRERTVDWTEPGLVITRMRFLGDQYRGPWDMSYCHGTLDGEDVRVRINRLAVCVMGYGMKGLRAAIYRAADHDGVRVNRICQGGHLDNVLSALW